MGGFWQYLCVGGIFVLLSVEDLFVGALYGVKYQVA
jgi:hypothetical protein